MLVYLREGSTQTNWVEGGKSNLLSHSITETDTLPASPTADPIKPGAWLYRFSVRTGRPGVCIVRVK